MRILANMTSQTLFWTLASILFLHDLRVFTEECPLGRFGKQCSGTCNCRDNQPCNRTSGLCANGCEDGFGGDQCNVVVEEQKLLWRILIISGASAGAVILLGIMVFVCHCCCCKRRSGGLEEVEASSDFRRSEHPQVELQRMESLDADQVLRGVVTSSTYSWGSEFSVTGDRRTYMDPGLLRGHNQNNGDRIYANGYIASDNDKNTTLGSSATMSLRSGMTGSTTLSSQQYVNLPTANEAGDDTGSHDSDREDYTLPYSHIQKPVFWG